MRFRNREEAGKLLAERLQRYRDQDTVVLGLPRGGLPVAREVARSLHAPLDVLVSRKLGAPGNPEFAIGAVTARGTRILNLQVVRRAMLPPGYLERETEAQRQLAVLRERSLRGVRPPEPLAGKLVILVDDGIATGMTMEAAIADARRAGARAIVVAAPVVAPDSYRYLQALTDDVVSLEVPPDFMAVGAYYEDFTQVSDEEARVQLVGVLNEAVE